MSALLSSYAAQRSAGREYPEASHKDHRGDFERDRDRILHCAAFRKLECKTQVFVNYEGNFSRTRLTHTLEVAQIARGIARRLRLNEDLTEAIALAHDLGHTPFGHTGEQELDRLMTGYGGFEHNLQSFRVVTELEDHHPGYPGLNLTYEVRKGLLKHSAGNSYIPEGFVSEHQPSLEAQIVDLADEIAYTSHDLDDGLNCGLITVEQLQDVPLWRSTWKQMIAKHGVCTGPILRYRTVSALISAAIDDLAVTTQLNLKDASIRTVADVRDATTRLVSFSSHMAAERLPLKQFLFANLYRHPQVDRSCQEAAHMLGILFRAYTKTPLMLPDSQRRHITRRGLHRTVADHLASLTDRLALQEYLTLISGLNPHPKE